MVDVQVDFCEGGALGVDGGIRVATDIAELLAGGHGYDAVVATRDHHIDPGAHFSATPDFVDSWPPHCVVGTPGQELHPALAGFGFDAVFDKGTFEAAYSGFEGATADGVPLARWLGLRGITDVDVCGIATDYCVAATATDAASEGFRTTVLTSLTAAVHAASTGAVHLRLREAGVTVEARPSAEAPGTRPITPVHGFGYIGSRCLALVTTVRNPAPGCLDVPNVTPRVTDPHPPTWENDT
uniref:isochorismatase family protein n=1 Tax=Tessaracoccus coleopterorum TaxID=2714950 RepID=UPI002F913192